MSKRPTEPRRTRNAAGLTQQASADLLGVALRTWEDWEGGRATMPDYALKLYRHVAGVERLPFKAAS